MAIYFLSTVPPLNYTMHKMHLNSICLIFEILTTILSNQHQSQFPNFLLIFTLSIFSFCGNLFWNFLWISLLFLKCYCLKFIHFNSIVSLYLVKVDCCVKHKATAAILFAHIGMKHERQKGKRDCPYSYFNI